MGRRECGNKLPSPVREATVFFVSLSTPLNLLSDCRRARCGQGQAASRWPLAILDLRCARRRGQGQVGTKERSGFDRTKERGIRRRPEITAPLFVLSARWYSSTLGGSRRP